MMKKFSLILGLLCFSASALDSPPELVKPPPSLPEVSKVAPQKCVKPKGKFAWNAEKTKLVDMVEQISKLTCKNFIISSNVRPNQELSIISQTPITLNQAWQAFEANLEANDLAVYKTGQFYKIIKRAESSRSPIPVYLEKDKLPNDEAMVTYMYDLKYIPKEIAQPLVKGMISRVGDVIVIGDGFLIITDASSNIKRVMKILGQIDISGAANKIHIIDLIHADAVQVQNKLNDIFSSKSSGAGASRRHIYDDFGPIRPPSAGSQDDFSLQKMVADERTNKLIIISSDRAFARIKEMIDVLDVPASGASSKGEIYVYHLKNADAKKLQTTLASIVQASRGGRRPQPGQSGQEEAFEGDVKISADEATNSLVILSSPRDYKSLTRVIAELDRRRAQVYVEAAVMELTVGDENVTDLGIFGGIPLGNGNKMLLATPRGKTLATDLFSSIAQSLGSNNSQATAALGLAPFLNTLGFLGADQTFTLNKHPVTVPGVGAIVNLLQKYTNSDILSTPSLMTLDNEKAEMSVGERIPTVSGISSGGVGGTAGGLLPIQNITYQEPKLKFSITPHINDDNLIRMEIEQDISEQTRSVLVTAGQPTQPVFSTKTSKTVVSAKDQQTIVLGGLMSDKVTLTETKVPFLGDIPLIGHLFKTTEKRKEKRNLLLILTPYVVRNDDDLRRIYERKSRERELFAKLYFGDKITKFDPYVDYEKKQGPLSNLINQVGYEMQKTENGGPGLPGEIVIRQKVHETQAKHQVRTLESYVEPEVSPEGVVQERYIEPKHLIPTEVITVEELPPPAPAPAPIEEFTPAPITLIEGSKTP